MSLCTTEDEGTTILQNKSKPSSSDAASDPRWRQLKTQHSEILKTHTIGTVCTVFSHTLAKLAPHTVYGDLTSRNKADQGPKWRLHQNIVWCLDVTLVNAYRNTAHPSITVLLCYMMIGVSDKRNQANIWLTKKKIHTHTRTHTEAEETSRHIRVTTQAIMDNTLFGGSMRTSHPVDTKERVAEETYGNWQGCNWTLNGMATASCHDSEAR